MGAGSGGRALPTIRAFALLKVEGNAARAMAFACIIPTVRAGSCICGNRGTAFATTYNGHFVYLLSLI